MCWRGRVCNEGWESLQSGWEGCLYAVSFGEDDPEDSRALPQRLMLSLRPEILNMKKLALAVLILSFAVVLAAKKKSTNGSDLLIQLESEFAADVAQRGHEAFITHFADDGVEVVDGGGFDNLEAIRKQPAWPDGASLTWKPIRAEMAASGDLGFTYGNYVFTSKNKEGKMVANHGKYTSIWRKQKDGQWKVIVDMGNSSPDPKP